MATNSILLLLAILLPKSFQVIDKNLVERDILLPYPSGLHHYDVTRTHRYVRECQQRIHGNLTHESILPKLKLDDVTVRYFYDDFAKNGKQLGHHAIVKDPLAMISVEEPIGGCAAPFTSTVSSTAIHNECYIAVNAGFFDPFDNKPTYGKCYGNVITNSEIKQTTGVQNANFGIRKDGTVVIGYLSQDEANNKTNPFVQLVSGVGWILRNGKSYVEESEKAECKDSQTTGTLEYFFNVKSARTLIGFDSNGHVHIVTVDGKTGERGTNMKGAVEYLKSFGVINAINLDGGGSATFVVNSTVINYPSDVKQGLIIPRKVSTIICVKKKMDDLVTPEHIESLSYCCNRNYLLVVGLSVLIGISLLLHVHFYSLYRHYRSIVKGIAGGQQQKEALQSLLQQPDYESSGVESEDEDDDEL